LGSQWGIKNPILKNFFKKFIFRIRILRGHQNIIFRKLFQEIIFGDRNFQGAIKNPILKNFFKKLFLGIEIFKGLSKIPF
jgi:hypothetical protein